MDDVLVPELDGSNHYPFTKVKDIVGRHEDALVFTNRHGREDFIHPIVIVELMIKGLNAWQIVIGSKTSFRFLARFNDGMSPQDCQATRDRIHHKMSSLLAEKEMDNVRFEIERVESLAIDPHSGKFRLVVRNRN
jgi:phenylacetate-CoA ligase